ncbi:MAG: hypothetical protein O9342_00385 [Beijerinckiaceae bacterium]|nr:hypothetical protein [Beijerinckiaceae bacterium]
MEHGLCQRPFEFKAMHDIAKCLHPDAFADADPEESFRDDHAGYLPVACSGQRFLPLKP